MTTPAQLALFNISPAKPTIEENGFPDFGTFKDSQKAPIHGWFRYPAGYSFKLVEYVFDQLHLNQEAWVYDPFSGSGTTLLCAQQAGINAYGVEAHSFVHWASSVKLYRDYEWDHLERYLARLVAEARTFVTSRFGTTDLTGIFPDLVYKCYHVRDLTELYLLREYILSVENQPLRDLLKLALTDVLRGAAAAGTGWPYISPRKNTGDKPPKGASSLFERTVWRMYRDLRNVVRLDPPPVIQNILGDSRQRQALNDGQIDLALTSPPYLNNFDYADRTRLETYFWGITQTWGQITREFRDRLIVSATTQVTRSKHQVETALDLAVRDADPKVYRIIQDAVLRLAQVRQTKGGKKDYDLMVALYFSDMLPVLREASRVIRSGGHFYLVLGDSAPYGVHIPTDELIGRLGVAVGFSNYVYHPFRARGGKWKANPQRHTVPLREGLVILTK